MIHHNSSKETVTLELFQGPGQVRKLVVHPGAEVDIDSTDVDAVPMLAPQLKPGPSPKKAKKDETGEGEPGSNAPPEGTQPAARGGRRKAETGEATPE